MRSRQHRAAVHAVGHVAERGVMDVVSPLIKELEDETKEIRQAAVDALVKVVNRGDPGDITQVAGLLEPGFWCPVLCWRSPGTRCG